MLELVSYLFNCWVGCPDYIGKTETCMEAMKYVK